MKNFQYASPKTKDEALQLLSENAGNGTVLAGGTDLLSLMKANLESPGLVVSLKALDEGREIRQSSRTTISIGALATLSDLIGNRLIQDHFPSLVQAARGVRSSQIRSVGTVGGDLCQRPRCWYYRNGFGLRPMHEGKSMVVEGDNRYHAILGASDNVYFVNPSSLAPALIALNARLTIAGSGGDRSMSLSDFFRVPGGDGEKEYDLNADELVLEIQVPSRPRTQNAVYEVRQKEALDWPLVAAAVSLVMESGRVKNASVVLGHVAPVPWVAAEASQSLIGKPINESTADRAGEAAVRGAEPLSRNAYKIRLARVAVKRALMKAAGMEV